MSDQGVLVDLHIQDYKSLCAPVMICRVHTDPGKSWNFIVQNSRPGKSWNGPGKLESPGILKQHFWIFFICGLSSRCV